MRGKFFIAQLELILFSRKKHYMQTILARPDALVVKENEVYYFISKQWMFESFLCFSLFLKLIIRNFEWVLVFLKHQPLKLFSDLLSWPHFCNGLKYESIVLIQWTFNETTYTAIISPLNLSATDKLTEQSPTYSKIEVSRALIVDHHKGIQAEL